MANVDLMGGDAQRIRSTYKNALQRDASDAEVTGWLSGSYGGGGVDAWANQIAQSDEARQRGTYKPPDGSENRDNPNTTQTQQPDFSPVTLPTQSNQGGNYWQFDGPAQQQIANWYWTYTGRMPGASDIGAHVGNPGGLPGIEQAIKNSPEAQAYAGRQQPPPGTNTTTTTGTGWDADPKGNFQNWFLQNTGSLAPSGKALEGLAPYLSKFGIKLGARNAQGMIDTIITPDGKAWDVIESATMDGGKRWQWIPAGGSGGTSYGGVGGGQLPGNQYSDPYTRMLEDLIKSRIGMLQQPINDPNRAMYEQAMKDRANQLGMGNQQLTQLMDYLQKRFTELQGPGYTGAENEAIRTGALDPIETDRAAARQRVMERLSARGLTPDSGIAQQALLEVDKAFDAMRGATQTTLTTNDLARREDRQQRAATIGGQLVDIPEARAREQLDVFQALDMLSQTMRDEEASRSREAIGYAGGLNDLTAQRLQLAMQAAGMGGNPASLLSGLTGIAGLNMNASAMNRANSGSMWSGLGSIMAILAGSR